MPSPDLVSSLTDEHVLRALMTHRRLTRAELATEVGISKPTAGESVRRLTARGLVADTGERTPGGRGRGRVGSYYALAPTLGPALAVAIAPEGVVAETVDVYGDTVARAERPVDRPTRPAQVAAALVAAATEVVRGRGVAGGGAAGGGGAGAVSGAGPAGGAGAVSGAGRAGAMAAARAAGGAGGAARVAVVSAADPVDRASGRLVHLPDSPFLVGELDPVALLAPLVSGPVVVDNDVNWAARSEHDRAPALRDFAYLYLGEGLGCAIVEDGAVRRGGSGLVGEIAHLLTVGPGGRALPFIAVFDELGLRRPGSTAIDVDRLLAGLDTTAPTLGAAIGGVIGAIVALADPERVLLGGPWGPAVLTGVRAATDRSPRTVPVHPARVDREPALTGVRADALARLRADVSAPDVTAPGDRPGPPPR